MPSTRNGTPSRRTNAPDIRQRGFVEAVAARPRFDPFGVELRVDRVGADMAGMERAPDLAEPVVVLAPTEGARAVAGREGRRLVQEEQLGEPAGL